MTIRRFAEIEEVARIIGVCLDAENMQEEGIELLTGNIYNTQTWKRIEPLLQTEFVCVYLKDKVLNPGQFALKRMMQVCNDLGAGMVYSDYYEKKNDVLSAHPVIEYQDGSLRDDFNFGSLWFVRTEVLKSAIDSQSRDYIFAALYDLRLKISQRAEIIHLPEFLYTEIESDLRQSGEKMFDYVDPRNRDRQIEMEQACTDHLKKISAFLKPEFKKVVFDEVNFPVEASVIIPVRNRETTIADAITSVLNQKTSFKFNLIVIDNHSTDNTANIVSSFKDDRLIHIIPDRDDLGIGGCWNEGVCNPQCGKFAIQLDSDDLYIDDNVLQRVVNAFYEQNCAMVVGSYQMVNFKLEEIPPGLIDHREWTPENGRNNALRINGLGAPRAFYTKVLREILLPNTSYGEDYALGLKISRMYQIGRIYEPLYLCRRWEDNSDASLSVEKMNAHNFYKDKIRTIELKARQKYVASRTVG